MLAGGGDAAWWLKRGWMAAFLVPFVLHLVLEGRTFEYEGAGSGCQYLTPLGTQQFDAAVRGLQVALAAWAVAGIAAATIAWLRRLESSPGAWLTLAGWLVPGAAAVLVAWNGPTAEGFSKLLLLVYVVPVLVVGSTLAMAVGLAWRRARGHGPFPLAALLRSQAALLAIVLAGSLLGGSGEIASC
jgi:hypothetical protein